MGCVGTLSDALHAQPVFWCPEGPAWYEAVHEHLRPLLFAAAFFLVLFFVEGMTEPRFPDASMTCTILLFSHSGYIPVRVRPSGESIPAIADDESPVHFKLAREREISTSLVFFDQISLIDFWRLAGPLERLTRSRIHAILSVPSFDCRTILFTPIPSSSNFTVRFLQFRGHPPGSATK